MRRDARKRRVLTICDASLSLCEGVTAGCRLQPAPPKLGQAVCALRRPREGGGRTDEPCSSDQCPAAGRWTFLPDEAGNRSKRRFALDRQAQTSRAAATKL